jgi:hypothetical protein
MLVFKLKKIEKSMPEDYSDIVDSVEKMTEL